MYGKLNIGQPGKPKKYIFVNKFYKDGDFSLKLGSTGLAGHDVITSKAVVLHTSRGAGTPDWPNGWPRDASGNIYNRMACVDIPPVAAPFQSSVG